MPVADARYLQLGDNLSANNLHFDMHRYFLSDTRWEHWRHRCSSHQLNICTNRPFDTSDQIGGTYAFKRLTRFKQVKSKLRDGIYETVKRELPQNIHVGVRPDKTSMLMLNVLVDYILLPILKWTRDAFNHEVLGSLTCVRQYIVEHFGCVVEMCNGMSHASVTHFCWKPSPAGTAPRRCCDNTAAVVEKYLTAVEVLVLLLSAGSPDPSANRWFTCAYHLRCAML